MDLIYDRGLNCHLASIVNIAGLLGVNYTDAFATLWSETDFTDESSYHIYASKRVFANLEALGVRIEKLDCNEMKAEESMARLPDRALLLIGMDTFYIPWHPVFGHFHDPHYFFARKKTARSVLCFDPVYGKKHIGIEPDDMFPYTFELSHVYQVDADPPEHGAAQEAREVLRRHPETREKLQAEILKCRGEEKSGVTTLIKQISAMISNRYLFRRFLHRSAWMSSRYGHFFNDPFFLRWEAVRNGLYKASIVKDNSRVVDEVSSLFSGLMLEETGMAKEIAAIAPGPGKQGEAAEKESLSPQ